MKRTPKKAKAVRDRDVRRALHKSALMPILKEAAAGRRRRTARQISGYLRGKGKPQAMGALVSLFMSNLQEWEKKLIAATTRTRSSRTTPPSGAGRQSFAIKKKNQTQASFY